MAYVILCFIEPGDQVLLAHYGVVHWLAEWLGGQSGRLLKVMGDFGGCLCRLHCIRLMLLLRHFDLEKLFFRSIYIFLWIIILMKSISELKKLVKLSD